MDRLQGCNHTMNKLKVWYFGKIAKAKIRKVLMKINQLYNIDILTFIWCFFYKSLIFEICSDYCKPHERMDANSKFEALLQKIRATERQRNLQSQLTTYSRRAFYFGNCNISYSNDTMWKILISEEMSQTEGSPIAFAESLIESIIRWWWCPPYKNLCI